MPFCQRRPHDLVEAAPRHDAVPARRTKIDGVERPGSDAAVATLQFGLATLLSRRSLLDIELKIGVTSDSPDFALTVSVPFRFQ